MLDKMSLMGSEEQLMQGSAEHLYDSIRQSARGPICGPGRTLDMQGYLHIKKSKRRFQL